MNVVTIINAHGAGIAAFRRHEKYWSKENRVVICPENDPVEVEGMVIREGLAEHNGRESWKRFQRILKYLELHDTTWKWCVMHEYDSFCLDARLPEHPGFYGNIFENKESPKYMAPRYANPPWTFDRESLLNMAAVARAYPSIFENGEADRYWSALAMMANVPILDYAPKGLSRGEIGHRDIPKLRSAIYEGAYAIHGVKQDWVLRAVEQFWDERPTSKNAYPS